MVRLFGTDGVRGIANSELTPELAMNIGRAAASVFTDHSNECPTVLIGKDTRLSSDMIEGALTAGLCSAGVNVQLLGVIPTPAVAFLVNKYKAVAGIMISASHNSFEFNGIKIFSNDGYKLPDALEERIEAIIAEQHNQPPICEHNRVGHVIPSPNPVTDYIEHLKGTISNTLTGMSVAFDCANGSACATARELFEGLGITCHFLHDHPDGMNINKNCGSTHIDTLSKFVIDNHLDLGIAFDGDADRCLAIDDTGELIDGDFILAICAHDMKSQHSLTNNTIVGTIMTNMGFNIFCKENDINFIATKVGDRYVLEEMLQEGYVIGGEQSGHIIFKDFATTGDGQLTAVQLLSLLKRQGHKLSEIKKIMTRYPQVIVNVMISNESKPAFYTDELIKEAIESAKRNLNDSGRIIVRPSGTEPLIRVMLEGKDTNQIQSIAQSVADLIKERLG